MREVEGILRMRPEIGKLGEEIRELRTSLTAHGGLFTPGVSSLTAAELWVLPLLTTHLTYEQIADEQFRSKHTIHAQPPHAPKQWHDPGSLPSSSDDPCSGRHEHPT